MTDPNACDIYWDKKNKNKLVLEEKRWANPLSYPLHPRSLKPSKRVHVRNTMFWKGKGGSWEQCGSNLVANSFKRPNAICCAVDSRHTTETKLKSAAAKGATEISVESTHNLHFGDTIRLDKDIKAIVDINESTNTFTLDEALENPYEIGAVVRKIGRFNKTLNSLFMKKLKILHMSARKPNLRGKVKSGPLKNAGGVNNIMALAAKGSDRIKGFSKRYWTKRG